MATILLVNKISFKTNENDRPTQKKICSLLFFVLFALLYPLGVFGQCDNDITLNNCASKLGTYNFIKYFTVGANQKKKSNPEFSYVFSTGSKYIMIACNENVVGGKMIVSLYDREHNLVASTYDESTKSYYDKLIYSCSATGVYYIRASFIDAKKGCGMCILGFDND